MFQEAHGASARFLVLQSPGCHSHCFSLVEQVIGAITNLRGGTLASTLPVKKQERICVSLESFWSLAATPPHLVYFAKETELLPCQLPLTPYLSLGDYTEI